ncbi:MAG: glycosyltransferase family 4 protein, partial [Gaiellaceae bacterium]
HPASDVLAFVELIDILRRERFDLLHTHNPKPGIMGRLAGRIAGVPCVVNTVHGLYATPASSLAQRATVLALERLAARFSDLELYQSEEDLRWAIRRRVVKPWKARYLGNGCDLTRFDPASVSPARLGELRAQLGILDGTLVVGAVGRLVAEKGYRELFEAARRVRSEQPGVAFIVVGAADPDKSDSISEEEMATASAEVTFLGWRDDVRDLLALMDVFVLASWREGFPRSAIEAAAMGKALVLTDIRGCREVARHGREALLVPPRQPAPLAAAITRLVADERLRRELGAAARARALDAFDEGRVARTVLDGYREVLSRQGRAAPQSNLTVRRAR